MTVVRLVTTIPKSQNSLPSFSAHVVTLKQSDRIEKSVSRRFEWTYFDSNLSS